MTPFRYLEPESLEEALTLLGTYGDTAKVIAGGTGLINLMKLGLTQPTVLIGLRLLTELKGLKADGDFTIGALTTLHVLETSPIVKANIPLLANACHHVATIRVRVMATLGGAVAHADPHLDTPPALIALDGRIRARSRRGEREIAADQFFTGYYETVLEPDELVTAIMVPPQPSRNGTSFLKFLPRTHDDYATVSVAARVTLGADRSVVDARVALGAVGWTPIRARSVEHALRGLRPSKESFREAASLVKDEVAPLDSSRGSVEYRRNMAVVHVYRALSEATLQAGYDIRHHQA
jgi:carbon-monoxide dehydrogenase medium subunit